MKVTFLGTNGWYDTATGNTVCVLLETKSSYLVFDAGNGFCKLDRYIKSAKPIYLFLSHYHLDHVIGLHALNKFDFRQGIDVYGPPGLKKLFGTVINAPYSISIKRLKTRVRLHEDGRFPIGISSKPLKHSVVCYGYRIFFEGKTVAYCTDTGVCPNLSFLARDVDLFIAECSYKQGQVVSNWPHLNPEQAARVAREAGAGQLALIHFDAALYLTKADRIKAEKIARGIFENTRAAQDGSVIEL